MSEINEKYLYSKDHEWAYHNGDIVTIGISHHAQNELGDIVFVELPEIGEKVASGDSFGTVEAVKTVAELYAPLSGEIVEVNEELADAAEILNQSPYENGWIVKMKISNPDEIKELMNSEAYSQYIS